MSIEEGKAARPERSPGFAKRFYAELEKGTMGVEEFDKFLAPESYNVKVRHESHYNKIRLMANRIWESKAPEAPEKAPEEKMPTKTHAGIASGMFESLANEGINIQTISASEIKISIVVDEKYLELAVRTLHEKFKLAQE